MLTLTYTSQFKKDMKRIRKRGYDTHLVDILLEKLRNEEILDETYQDHPLKGKYLGFRECNVKSDWLLIYIIKENELVLTASRTGTHSDLFNEQRSDLALFSALAEGYQSSGEQRLDPSMTSKRTGNSEY